MQYLDFDKFKAIDASKFRATHPYPWINPQGLLTDTGYKHLLDNMPDISLFEKKFGYGRIAGQKPHDRYSLEYAPDTPVPEPWKEFIAELCSDGYRSTLAKLFGARKINLRFHWHYTPNGCSVSPHCDSRRKLGSHIFYFSPEGEWQPEWGGQTLVLDDDGKFDVESSPEFGDFIDMKAADSIGNKSFLFRRRGNSWHGVEEINCPEDKMRKVFIVVINSNTPFQRIKRWIKSKPVPGY